MDRYIFILLVAILPLNTELFSQDSTFLFWQAYSSIDSMLTGKSQMSFKKAVFITENAYLNNTLSLKSFENDIVLLKSLSDVVAQSNLINYSASDKEQVLKSAALFKVMLDTIPVVLDEKRIFVHVPFVYDFEDVWGNQDYSKNFVSKLLLTNKGNCHSLPFLFKIIADELQIPAYLAMAPNHIYIKQYCKKTGWYNTELTSATFPIDAWLMASGYVHLDAIRNGLYMDTLSVKQSIAFTLLDLAKGYEHKFGISNPKFIFDCVDTALKYLPNNVNVMLYNAESKKCFIELQMKTQNVKKPQELFSNVEIKQIYEDMECTYSRLYQLGYRRMPDDMYIKWLTMLKTEPEKYIDKKVIYKFENK
jgi:hypothetical protein